MERLVDLVTGARSTPSPSPSPASKPAANFNDILNEKLQETSPDIDLSIASQEIHSENLLVGITTEDSPTVSHVMLNNNSLKDKSWQIILSDINKEKTYTAIPLGSEIYYNSKTGELNWSKPAQFQKVAADVNDPKDNIELLENPAVITKKNEKVYTQPPVIPHPNRSLGRLDSKLPTVSHLLAASSEFSVEKWNILAHSINKDKDFSAIPENTEIWINLNTSEISWQQARPGSSIDTIKFIAEGGKPFSDANQGFSPSAKQTEVFINSSTHSISFFNNTTEKPQTNPVTDKTFPPDLTEAVKSYIGVPYNELDCYGLVVKGLKKMGLPYSGRDGLRNKLTSMAKESGLPSNAYLTGEGIIKATGKQVFTQTSTAINNSAAEAEKTFQDMKQVLQKGQILSFSTPTRGHTGIISLHNEQWTFINSGRMDNNVSKVARSKEVGEEDLFNEVQNWFKLAQQNKESLLVTLGQLETGKIRNTLQPSFQLSQTM